MQEYSKDHIVHVTSYFKRHFENREFNDHFELQRYIQSNKTGQSSIINTGRVYLKYCEECERLPDEVIRKYRSVLKIKKSNQDHYVPTDAELLENYQKIKNHTALNIIYLVLATSGIRYIECLDFLKNYDKTRATIKDNYVSYAINEIRHTKNINNIYLPLFVYKQLSSVNNSYQSLRMRIKKRGSTLSLKYLRKWHYNFLLYNNVPESVADFIQGRASKTISANHYLAKSQQADFWYSKLVSKFEDIFK